MKRALQVKRKTHEAPEATPAKNTSASSPSVVRPLEPLRGSLTVIGELVGLIDRGQTH